MADYKTTPDGIIKTGDARISNNTVAEASRKVNAATPAGVTTTSTIAGQTANLTNEFQRETAQDAAERRAEMYRNNDSTWENIKDKASDAYHDVKDSVSDAAEDVKDTFSDAKNRVENKVDDMRYRHDTKEAIQDRADAVKDRVQNQADELKYRTTQDMDATRGTLYGTAGTVAAGTAATRNRVEDRIEREDSKMQRELEQKSRDLEDAIDLKEKEMEILGKIDGKDLPDDLNE